MIKNKKGVSLQEAMTGLGILILSFIILLLFYRYLDSREIIDDEVCHQSALIKSSFNLGHYIEVGRETIPLKCKAKRICLFDKDKNCGFTYKEDVEYVGVKNTEDIAKNIAENMYLAWDVIGGKGYFQLFKRASVWQNDKRKNCVVYARIKTSNEFSGKKTDLDSYLLRSSPSKVSYWQVFAGYGTDATGVINLRKSTPIVTSYKNIDLSKEYWVLYVEMEQNQVPVFEKLPGVSETIEFTSDKINEMLGFKNEENVLRFVITLPYENVVSSDLCDEFYGVV
ncbi:hypothetical protein HYW76_01830 [Candidatus Pacearchaeota archaeon]|nr:hypothetical protein [Candidatus Pacearchaeota archaeon]